MERQDYSVQRDTGDIALTASPPRARHAGQPCDLILHDNVAELYSLTVQ
jgi:hypothetical protein